MKNSAVGDTLSRIQELIAAETGSPLAGESAKRLERVIEQALRSSSRPGHGEEFLTREVTILLTDLRGFTSVSEAYPVSVVLELLNRYLIKMSEVVIRHKGTIDKFMGDSIMVLFGVPHAAEDDVERAVACAVDMQIAMTELNRQHKQIGMPELYMGIGINTGVVMAGMLGSDLYSEYTVIGNEVNLASRIEAVSLRGQVLISEQTFDRCRAFVKTGDPMDVFVKGKADSVSLREVLAIPSVEKEVPRQEMRRSPRVEVKMPFAYQSIRNKMIMPQANQGMIVDISYHGILAEVEQQLAPHSEIKLEFALSLIGYKASEIYARILKTQPHGNAFWSSVEFTGVGAETSTNIRRFIHLLLQGA